MAGPGDVRGRQEGAIGADLDGGAFVVDGEDEAGNVTSLLDGVAPIVVFVGVELAEIVFEDVGELAAPAVAAIVNVEAVADGLVGGLLHLDVERGVDTETALMNGFGAVGGFQVFANLFKEVGSEIVARILQVQAEGRFPCGFFFGRGDLSFLAHLVKDEVAASEGARGVDERRIDRAANHAREERGFLELQIADGLAEIELRGGGETVVSVSEIDLIGVMVKICGLV